MMRQKLWLLFILVTPNRQRKCQIMHFFLLFSTSFLKRIPATFGVLPQGNILKENLQEVQTLSAIYPPPHTIAAKSMAIGAWARLNYIASLLAGVHSILKISHGNDIQKQKNWQHFDHCRYGDIHLDNICLSFFFLLSAGADVLQGYV